MCVFFFLDKVDSRCSTANLIVCSLFVRSVQHQKYVRWCAFMIHTQWHFITNSSFMGEKWQHNKMESHYWIWWHINDFAFANQTCFFSSAIKIIEQRNKGKGREHATVIGNNFHQIILIDGHFFSIYNYMWNSICDFDFQIKMCFCHLLLWLITNSVHLKKLSIFRANHKFRIISMFVIKWKKNTKHFNLSFHQKIP